MAKPRCPMCRTISITPHAGKDQWYCQNCRLAFEAVNDGTVTYGDPARIAERRETRAQRRRA